MNHQTEIEVDGRMIRTLSDILPPPGRTRMLIIGKTPAPISVEAGHYFQGKQGRIFWKSLKENGLLKVPRGADYEDEVLLKHGYGVTDMVKVPHDFGTEPSDEEYKRGLCRLQKLISHLSPRILLFVYKGALDRLLDLGYQEKTKSRYGFNPELEPLFQSKVFVFPMPGTPCTRDEAQQAMSEIGTELTCTCV